MQVCEVAPPADVEPMAWLLLTTGAVQTVQDASERVAWYAGRWGMEVWHRMLQSGCRLAARQWRTGERLQHCVTLESVMAWRVFYATMLARAIPAMPGEVLLELAEWPAWECALHHCLTPPAEPPTLEQAVRWLAHRGGFRRAPSQRSTRPRDLMAWLATSP